MAFTGPLFTVPVKGLVKIAWTGGAAGDAGAFAKLGGYQLMSSQFEGTFGTSTLSLEGRNDGANARVLNDPQGNALSGIAAAKIEAILEPVEEIRPVVSAGTGTAMAVTVWAKAVK